MCQKVFVVFPVNTMKEVTENPTLGATSILNGIYVSIGKNLDEIKILENAKYLKLSKKDDECSIHEYACVANILDFFEENKHRVIIICTISKKYKVFRSKQYIYCISELKNTDEIDRILHIHYLL
ncbi:hypothetical protein HC864_03895 [Candidatus Gracilibacteria bacterium]|nr:hypothetical protein [Candidatus Gracilibacteria bacterium]